MNKMMIIPLAIMLILTIFAFTYSGTQKVYDVSDEDIPVSGGNLSVNNTTTEVEVPGIILKEVDIWGVGIIIFLTVAISVGVLLGLGILGSGFSVFSQKLVFSAILFIGLWGVLSVVCEPLIMSEGMGSFGTLSWIGLTFTYVLGFGFMIEGDDD